MFYILSLTFTKISILFLYVKVLTYDSLRKASYIMLVVVLGYHVIALILVMTACVPLQRYWDRNVSGYCYPDRVWLALFWTNTGMNIATDFSIFLLPIPTVAKLWLPTRAKVGLVIVFALGFL